MLDNPIQSADRENLLAGIIARSKKDNRREVQNVRLRLASARTEALRLAKDLSSLQGVLRVIHFGSSASGQNFRLDSDIDLAISGGDILESMRLAESSDYNVDIIEIDTVPSPLKEAILDQGVVLYEKRS